MTLKNFTCVYIHVILEKHIYTIKQSFAQDCSIFGLIKNINELTQMTNRSGDETAYTPGVEAGMC